MPSEVQELELRVVVSPHVGAGKGFSVPQEEKQVFSITELSLQPYKVVIFQWIEDVDAGFLRIWLMSPSKASLCILRKLDFRVSLWRVNHWKLCTALRLHHYHL